VSAAAISSSLFEAARLGDPQAIASLLETAQPDIRRYARATCRSSADAEDATQEAMWILFRHVGTIRSLVAFSAWLFSVVRRECLRLARKAGLAPSIDDGEAETLLLSRSEADLLGFLDADGTCDPQFFATLCKRLVEDDADVVLGCRLNKGSQMPLIRRIGNKLFAQLLSAFSSQTVRDTASGMRVVRRSALRHLYPLPVGLHFTPAMSARAMLSDATRILEIDMPYAEREGESKLNVIRDGFRFLRVILESALLYRPERVLLAGAVLCAVAGVSLMLQPLVAYWQTRTVAEWMIYRFLVSALTAQVALLLWAAAVTSSRIVAIAMHEEMRPIAAPWIRTRWFWSLLASLVLASFVLVWPSAEQLWRTGHTDIHWSRFVVAMQSLGAAALLLVVRGIDRILDLVEERVHYLWNQG